MKNKRGSSAVLLSMIFVTFAMAIVSSILIARAWTVRSECEVFGRVFAKAVLSEYDRHLLEDYCLLAYQGNDASVEQKIRQYAHYSMKGRLHIDKIGIEADLSGYEMNDLANFRKAMKDGFGSSLASSLIRGGNRRARDKDEELPERVIANPVMLDTLPSGGSSSSISTDAIGEKLKSGDFASSLTDAGSAAAVDIAFIRTYFGSHTMAAGSKEPYFPHEMEYLICGKPDDQANYKSCRRRIFLVRNAMNLAAVYQDPAKVELVAAAAELITPGPLGVVTQGILMEAWAALESEQDVRTLTEGGRVPLLKTPEQWQTGFESVLSGKEVQKKLDENSRELLEEKKGEILEEAGKVSAAKEITEGQTYEDYLMAMILLTGSGTRMLRIMDLVQINMKYRYYEDFNLAEYYTGVRFSAHVEQSSYEFEDHYR